MYKWIPLYIMLVLALALAACGGEEEEPTPDPVAVPTDTPEPVEPTPTLEAEPTPISLVGEEEVEVVREPSVFFEALQDLRSYRIQVSWRWEPEDETLADAEAWEMVIEVVNDDPMRERVRMRMEEGVNGELAEEESFELIRIGDQQYTKLGLMGWIETPVDEGEEDMTASFADPAFFVEDVENLRRVQPDQTINGILSRHYVFTADDLLEELDDEFTAFEGDIFVAVDGGFVTRYEIRGHSSETMFDLEFEEGEEQREVVGVFTVRYDLEAVNEDIIIEAPEDAGAFGLPGLEEGVPADLPMPEDAEVSFSMMGMTQFSTQLSLEGVAEFYQEALAELGWQLEAEPMITEAMIMLNFASDEEVLTVMAEPHDEREGYTSVFITMQ